MKEYNYTKKTIEFVKVALSCRAAEPGTEIQPLSFSDILSNEETQRQRYYKDGTKYVQFTILANNSNYIIGYVASTSVAGIPPKRNYRNGTTEELNLKEGEGLGYANIFLYYKTKKILLYEFNKNGCYLSAFKDLLYNACNIVFRDIRITLSFFPVLKKNAYDEFYSMRIYKAVEYVVANPGAMQIEQEKNNQATNALCEISKESREIQADSLTLKYATSLKNNPYGLKRSAVMDIINSIYGKIDVKKIIVTGLIEDPEERASQSIDLLSEALKDKMKLKEPRILKNLLIPERQAGILKVFNKNLEEIDNMF